jgi:glycosyltransferase involved in cell wall biosynthesis
MKNKQRILLITWNYPPKIGGMENLLSKLVEQIKTQAEIDVIAPYADDSKGIRHKGLYRASRGGLIWFFIYSFFKGNQLLANDEYKVVMGGSVLPSPIVWLLGVFHNTPIAVYAHGLDLIFTNSLYQLVIKLILPKMDLVIVNSSQTGELARNKGVSAETISVIHPGIEMNDFDREVNIDELKKKYNLDGKLVLLSVGRLAKRKGIPEFIKYSLSEIVKTNDHVVFCVIGGNPEKSLLHKKDIQQLIELEVSERGLEENVQLFGWVTRDVLLEMYFVCDIFILPAIYVPDDVEGFGIVLAEANAAGKPVVSTKLGGIQDAVANCQSGILVEPGNWGEFTAAITDLIEDESLRYSMGNFGSERVKLEFDWPVIGRKFLKSIEGLD